MTPQAQLVMILWLPIVLYLFIRFPAQRAVVISFIVAWMFLPQRAGFSIPSLPDYERMSATCYSILLATFIYDAQRFSTFKFGWIDVPMLIVCLCPFASSISNGLGVYDGISAILDKTVSFGVPYFLGRIYLNNLAGLRQLAMGIFIGGLVYIPLCLYEAKFSPQLHMIVYGYHGIRQFGQSIRLGGYRPNIFMQHGLSVGMWMMAASLIGIWLWQAGILKKLWHIPITVLLVILIVTFVLVKSTGAYIYLGYGILIMVSAKWFRTAFPLLLLIAIVSSYIYMGATGNFSGAQADQIVVTAQNLAGPDRAQSLEFRLDNEEILGEKARQRMILGWGGWGRNRVYDPDTGEDISVTDSLWIITFGVNGIVGLFSVFGSSLLPAFSFFWLRYPASTWFNPKVAPVAMLAVVTTLYALDCTLNNQANPVFTLASGGIAGVVLKEPEHLKIKRQSNKSKSSRLSPKQRQLRRLDSS